MEKLSHVRGDISEKDIEIKSKGAFEHSSSLSSSTAAIPPPSYDQVASSASLTNPFPELLFNPSTLLTVHAQGKPFFGMSCHSAEMEIRIYAGTDTYTEPAYLSCRPKRRSNNAVLRHFVKGDLLATTYKFGPFRDPSIRSLNSQLTAELHEKSDHGTEIVNIKTHGCSMTSRVITLTGIEHAGRSFDWQYKRIHTADGKKHKTIMLTMRDCNVPTPEAGKVLAILLRTDETRTPGTRKSDAGNGGQLFLDAEATRYMNEELVIASCLMVLKIEIDRQSVAQAAIISAAASS